MKVNYVKLTAGVLTGFMALSSVPYAVYAAGPTAGVIKKYSYANAKSFSYFLKLIWFWIAFTAFIFLYGR